jgi:hypothetical protein
MQKPSIDWTSIRQEANDILAESAALEPFRVQMRAVFAPMMSRPAYSRRPPVSLRLICGTDPPMKLIVRPAWPPLNLDRIHCELLQQRGTTHEGEAVRQYDLMLTLRCTPQHREVGRMRTSAVKNVRTVITTIEAFLRDPIGMLARSHDHCCCCGRRLTDELSRARGIGPECIKIIDLILCRPTDWNNLVQPEMAGQA